MTLTRTDVENRYEAILKRITAVRPVSEVTIVAITKYQPSEAVQFAYEIGLRNFGENYLPGLESRKNDHADLDDAIWHFVGGIQKNKLKQIVANADVIQTVDREALLRGLSTENHHPSLFVQVNLTEEPQRSGCPWSDTPELVAQMRKQSLPIRGLMGIGPVEGGEAARKLFRRLAQVASDLELSELSVGMSDDFEVAIEEGATMVRLGTALFGARPHSLQ